MDIILTARLVLAGFGLALLTLIVVGNYKFFATGGFNAYPTAWTLPAILADTIGGVALFVWAISNAKLGT